jgi:glutamine---fructose-6-phosphate transaminase (isomerizing)
MTAIFTPTSSDVTRKAEKLLEKFPDPFIAEIAAQPAAIRRSAAGLHDQLAALHRIPAVRNGRQLVFTGMGGSYDTCYAPVTALASVGIGGLMVDSAELLYFRRATLGGATLLVVVSQSGESAEVVRLMEELHRGPEGPFVVSVTNGPSNTVARMANVALDSRAGQEEGPSTMTFAGALVVLAALSDVLSGQSADDAVERVSFESQVAAESVERVLASIDDRAQRLHDWLGDRSVLTLLARGAGRAASEMGALTLKEAARFPAEAMESAQFRHGPLELAGREAAVVLIATEPATREVDARLATELVKAGVAVLRITSEGDQVPGAESIALGPVDRALAAAAAIVPIQLLAWRLAVDRGFPPGTYTRGSKITAHE